MKYLCFPYYLKLGELIHRKKILYIKKLIDTLIVLNIMLALILDLSYR